MPGLFEDPEVLAAMPFFSKLLPILKSGIVRPARLTGRHYEEVSRQVWSAVFATLSGNGGAAANLGALARTLENMKGAGRW